jgi:hypothetical protein
MIFEIVFMVHARSVDISAPQEGISDNAMRLLSKVYKERHDVNGIHRLEGAGNGDGEKAAGWARKKGGENEPIRP